MAISDICFRFGVDNHFDIFMDKDLGLKFSEESHYSQWKLFLRYFRKEFKK